MPWLFSSSFFLYFTCFFKKKEKAHTPTHWYLIYSIESLFCLFLHQFLFSVAIILYFWEKTVSDTLPKKICLWCKCHDMSLAVFSLESFLLHSTYRRIVWISTIRKLVRTFYPRILVWDSRGSTFSTYERLLVMNEKNSIGRIFGTVSTQPPHNGDIPFFHLSSHVELYLTFLLVGVTLLFPPTRNGISKRDIVMLLLCVP